ncbi:MAG TPA: M67 family metallopeptidase [Anaerolineaceae bacterium]|nr:M67 family metallopeptidase [Anaerolineaceae bacterium]
MTLAIPSTLLGEIYAVVERAYPEEGAGFLLGSDGPVRRVASVFPLANASEDAARRNRYLITPEDYLKGELEAEAQGIDIIGVFHSHPDHPERPSEFDREWAQPYFSYLITSVQSGRAIESRSWRLTDDRAQFIEEAIEITL